MKVILLKDVARLGRKSEIKDVPHGHALNFLIPRGFAKPATTQNIKQLEEIQKKQSKHNQDEKAQFTASLKALEGKTVTIKIEANEKGHLFKGLHEKDVLSALNDEDGVVLAESYISLSEPIKELGTHEVTLSCEGETEAVQLEVVAK